LARSHLSLRLLFPVGQPSHLTFDPFHGLPSSMDQQQAEAAAPAQQQQQQQQGATADSDVASTPLTPGTYFKTLYPDVVPQAAICAAFKWCDGAQSDFTSKHKALPEEVAKRQEYGSVMRSNAIEFLVPMEEWTEKVSCKTSVHVQPSLQRLGRTSFAFRISINAEDGQPLARVESVLVAVNPEDLTKPIVVPYQEEYRRALRPAVVPDVHVAPVAPGARPASAFVWRTIVRKSDCDALQHINNAIYGSLIEDARGAAAMAGALPRNLANVEEPNGFPRAALIEYLGQPHEGDLLNIAVWCDEDKGVVYFELFMENGAVVAKASILCNGFPLPPPANFVGSSFVKPAASKL